MLEHMMKTTLLVLILLFFATPSTAGDSFSSGFSAGVQAREVQERARHNREMERLRQQNMEMELDKQRQLIELERQRLELQSQRLELERMKNQQNFIQDSQVSSSEELCGDYESIDDCPVHKAGYAWARGNNINEKQHCKGSSLDYVLGCVGMFCMGG